MGIHRHLLVDRIGILIVIGDKDLYSFALGQLYGMAKLHAEIVPGGKIVVIKEKYARRLEYYPEYHSKAKNRKAAEITVGANIPFGGKGSAGSKALYRWFKLTLAPDEFEPGEFKHFQSMLELFLPDFNYPKLFETGKVNYLELAADTFWHPIEGLLPYRKYVKKSDIFHDSDGEPGTIYLGSPRSRQYCRVYDKKKQLLDKGKEPYHDKWHHTRIEVATRRLALSPKNLIQMKNPFPKLRVADLLKALAASTDSDWQKFIAESLIVGVPMALASRPEKREKYLAMLDQNQVDWWKPADMWTQLPGALARIAP